MEKGPKIAIIVESVVIIALVLLIFFYYNPHHQQVKNGLLSPRVYSGLIKPQSYLILNLKPLQKEMQNYFNYESINASLYVANLRDGVSFGINSNKEFDPVSLNKLPIAIIVLRKVESGNLSLETKIPIKKEYLSDKSGELYKRNVTELTVRELIHYMLSESDNTATYALLSMVPFDELQKLAQYLNYYNPSLDSEYPSPNNNVFMITAKSTYNIFMSLYLSTVLDAEHSELILSDLINTSFNINKVARLPNDVIVAQKYGVYYDSNNKNKELFHSCGIMYVQETRFFYCVMTEDLSLSRGEQITGEIVSRIYNYIINTKSYLDNNSI